MRKLFGILAFTAIFGTAMAQEGGNFQVTAILGNNPMFSSGTYMLPNYSNTVTGLPNGNEPDYYLNLGRTGGNSITNMTGVQLAYYLGPIDVNFMYAQDLSVTPKKDYVYANKGVIDGDNILDYTEEGAGLYKIPDQRQIEGSLKSNWYLNVGGNFHVENKRANGYGGVRLGYKKSRYETVTPYNGNNEYSDDVLYYPQSREGRVKAFQTAIVAGAECVANCGFVFGVEFLPFSYQYSVIEIDPDGLHHYACGNHSVKFFSTPTLKLGVRF
ncbi:MAG: hypothetical protein IJ911_02795 [Salinivirgaceae bacterium]|nr:hypothetical protein [Salinivirgaceae bacterium]